MPKGQEGYRSLLVPRTPRCREAYGFAWPWICARPNARIRWISRAMNNVSPYELIPNTIITYNTVRRNNRLATTEMVLSIVSLGRFLARCDLSCVFGRPEERTSKHILLSDGE